MRRTMTVQGLRTSTEVVRARAAQQSGSVSDCSGRAAGTAQGRFADVLAAMGAGSNVRFSAHAANRVEQRGLPIDQNEIGRVGQAIDVASSKGAEHSLIMGPGYALIVHVPNRTVVTAMEPQALRESVITNIDSAVFTR